MERNVEVVCEDCGASYGIVTDMDTTKYEVSVCTFCGSDNIEAELVVRRVEESEDEE